MNLNLIEEAQQFNDLNKTLTILIEECSEVIQNCCKIQRFGTDSYHPDNPDKTNFHLLQDELGDLYAMLTILVANNEITMYQLESKALKKLEKLKKFYNYSSRKTASKAE